MIKRETKAFWQVYNELIKAIMKHNEIFSKFVDSFFCEWTQKRKEKKRIKKIQWIWIY